MTDSEPLRITEIGPSISPIAHILREDLVPKDAVIAFIEPSKSVLDGLSFSIKADEIKSVIIQAELPNLPYGNNSQDIIVVSNVFGSPGAIAREVEFNDDPFGYIGELQKTTHPWMEEIKRVVKPNGKIIILETSTPLPIDAMENLCKNEDLQIIEKHERDETSKIFDPNNKIGFKFATLIQEGSNKGSYALVLEKE